MDVTITNAGGRIEIVDLRNGFTNSYDVLKDGLRLFNLGDIVRITFVNRRNIEIDYTEVELINGATSIIPVSGVDFLNELNVLLGDFGGGGPGDVPTLQEVTDEGNTTDNDIAFTNAGLTFDNGAKFKKGTTDGGLGGAKGVAQICSIDYELKWEAGRLYVMEQNGFTIREVRYTFTSIPNEFDDITKGYVVGSRWVLDNGNVYICSDNTLDNAVWALQTIGGGDMFKSVYDTDNDGNVDKAETVQIIVRNSTGVTLTKGQIVYLSGATGNRPNAVLAQANNVNSKKTIGWVTANIANNSDGFVAISGSAHDLNTSSFSAGDLLYLSATVAGGITATIPAHPNYEIFIGVCARSHPNFGRIIFKIAEVLEIESLHDVLITSVTDNDGLFYESSTQLWKNKTIATALGYTPVTDLRTITINGVTQDLSANRTFTQNFELIVAASDETTALTTGTNKVIFRMPRAITLTSVRASLTTAQASGTIFTVDINENGTSILSTKITIDNTEKTSTTAAILPVISDSSLADDSEISIDIDQIGNGTATGLKVYLIGTY
jgi:hypothetical protein